MTILILEGPNLNRLGSREPEVYGSDSAQARHERIRAVARTIQIEVDFFQSNHEGELVDRIQSADTGYDGVIINPAGFTHSSVAIRDAIAMSSTATIEVHITNLHAREAFRRRSVIAGACWGQITGLGVEGYLAALAAFAAKASP